MLFQKGIILQQNKEPAFSKDICEYLNSGRAYETFEGFERPEKVTMEALADCAEKACIIDESDGVLLYRKLLELKNKDYMRIVADAIDDEPYISSQMAAAYWRSTEVTGGLELLKEASGVEKVYIAIYENIDETNVKLPQSINDIAVKRISGRYPAEQRAKRKLSKKNAFTVGSGALVHLYRAYYESRKQTTAFITVHGDCISNPMNLEVSLGMTVQQVLDKCGLNAQPARVVVGGSMMGISILDTERTLITPTTAAVLAFKENHRGRNFTCIGCGRCTENCPMGLSPYYIYKFIKAGRYDRLEKFDADDCIGCGICSYNCPAKLELSATIFEFVHSDKYKAGINELHREKEETPLKLIIEKPEKETSKKKDSPTEQKSHESKPEPEKKEITKTDTSDGKKAESKTVKSKGRPPEKSKKKKHKGA